MLEEALQAAKKARFHILDVMEKVMDKPRDHVSAYAPVILTVNIPPEKIGEVIGPVARLSTASSVTRSTRN